MFVVENLKEMGSGCATTMDEGQLWKGVKGLGVSGAKQQGQRETSLRRKRKIWPCVGILSIQLGSSGNVGKASSPGKM